MAKMFYTLDEAKAALGRSEDEVKTLVDQNKLRQYRDGAKLMFKADQVEALKADLGSGPVPSSPGSG
jgi:excisionase family DNA binding protein